jgi:multiple sugar transport system permease protein
MAAHVKDASSGTDAHGAGDRAPERNQPRDLPGRKKRRSRIHGSPLIPYLLLGPAALYVILFQGVPLVREAILSFTQTSLLRPNEMKPVGWDNYIDLFGETSFRGTLMVTAIYVLVCVVGTISIGLGAALVMDLAFRGRGIVRALIIIPWAAPPVAVALIVTWMLNPDFGIINRSLGALGITNGHTSWLDNPDLALPTILVSTIWSLFPFSAVVFLAALQSVSQDLREASVVDGANWGQTFGAVVWPTIRPTVGMLSVLVFIWSVRRFELIWLMTQGGPAGATNTLVIDLYRRGFQFNQLGDAAAVGMVGLTISLTVTLLYFYMSQRAEREDRT